MSRQSAEIRTESYIHVGGTLVLVDALQEEQRAQVATELSRMMLTAAFCGRAVFTLQSPTEKGLSLP